MLIVYCLLLWLLLGDFGLVIIAGLFAFFATAWLADTFWGLFVANEKVKQWLASVTVLGVIGFAVLSVVPWR